MLQDAEALDGVLATIDAASRSRRVLIVPGGGPFADAVRGVDRRLGLPDSTAHWMAVLAMDQYAHVIAARIAGAALVSDPREIGAALAAGRLPVLAPARWLRAADPLPHSWNVTSDSIAAWVAGHVGARRIVLVKPAGVRASGEAVDSCFAGVLPADVEAAIVGADQLSTLKSQLSVPER